MTTMILFLYDLCHFQILSVTQDETCDLAHLTKTDAIDAIMYVCWNFLLLPYLPSLFCWIHMIGNILFKFVLMALE